MTDYHIVSGKVGRNTVYQVFLGMTKIGDPYPTRELAEAYIKLLQERAKQAQDTAESD